jgi:hypothetical protein
VRSCCPTRRGVTDPRISACVVRKSSRANTRTRRSTSRRTCHESGNPASPCHCVARRRPIPRAAHPTARDANAGIYPAAWDALRGIEVDLRRRMDPVRRCGVQDPTAWTAAVRPQRSWPWVQGSSARVASGTMAVAERSGSLFGPAACRGYDHADAGHGNQISGPGQPGVRPGRGLPGDAEPVSELVPGRSRAAGCPLPGPDLRLDDPGDLQVTRDTREVIKIIRHAGHPS